MTLSDWMLQTGTTQSALSRLLRATPDTVRRWLDSGNVPNRKFLARLAQVTKGNVTVEDFAKEVDPRILTLGEVVKRAPPR